MNVNQAAFCTITPLTIVTIGSVVAAATAATITATVAYAILAALGSALSIAAMTAWGASREGDSAGAYFQRFTSHIGYSITGMGQFIAQTLFFGVINAITQAISTLIFEKIAGRRRAEH